MPRRSGAPRALREIGVAVFFLALALLATRPLAGDLWSRTLVGPDPLGDLWTVHWVSGHLLPPAQLFGGNIFFPDPNAVLYNDLCLGTAVFLVPLRLVLPDPVPLYNAGVLLALAFGGWSFCLLARELTGSLWAGLLAGVLAAFGSHQMSHVYHLNLLNNGWLALFLLGLHRLLSRPSWRAAALAGVSFALTAQSTGYYGVAAAVLALVVAACRWRALRDRRVLVHAAGAALLAALLVAPYARAFLSLKEREGLRRPPGMSVRLAFLPERDLTSWGYLYRGVLGSGGERLFPGLLTLMLAPLAVTRRRPQAGVYCVAALVMLLLSLGPQLALGGLTVPLPYRWLFAIPPFDSMRHPYTFAAVATFLLAVLAGLGFAALRCSTRPWAGPAVVGLAILETLAPPARVRPIPPGLPPAWERLASLPPGPVLELPVFAPEPLVWAARSGRPTANGVGAFAPPSTLVLDRYVTNHWLEKAPEDVDDSRPAEWLAEKFPVRYVIVGHTPPMRRLARAFDRSRSFTLAAEADDGDRIYEFRRERVGSADGGEGGEQPAEVAGEERQAVGH